MPAISVTAVPLEPCRPLLCSVRSFFSDEGGSTMPNRRRPSAASAQPKREETSSSETACEAPTVLLVEDNRLDARLIRHAFEEGQLQCALHVVEDGRSALDFLRRRGRYATSPRPHLVILDLNLPGMAGGELLAELKSNRKLRSIPVVILSGAASFEDIRRSYRMFANSCVHKPLDADGFVSTVRLIKDFWLRQAALPGF